MIAQLENIVITTLPIIHKLSIDGLLDTLPALIAVHHPLAPVSHKMNNPYLRLEFEDFKVVKPLPPVPEGEEPFQPIVYFTEDMAKQIIDFIINILYKVNTLYIHCEGGYSRSPAIALALKRIFNFMKVYSIRNITRPNPLVYNLILKEYSHQYNHYLCQMIKASKESFNQINEHQINPVYELMDFIEKEEDGFISTIGVNESTKIKYLNIK
jgi:predicted protein tyrosine phosphatase